MEFKSLEVIQETDSFEEWVKKNMSQCSSHIGVFRGYNENRFISYDLQIIDLKTSSSSISTKKLCRKIVHRIFNSF